MTEQETNALYQSIKDAFDKYDSAAKTVASIQKFYGKPGPIKLYQNHNTTNTAKTFAFEQFGPKREHKLTPDQEETLMMIVSGLLKKEGGRIVMLEEELGEKGDTVLFEVHEKDGYVSVDLIPAYVQTGHEEPDGGSVVPDSMTEDIVDTFTRPSGIGGTYKASGTWTTFPSINATTSNAQVNLSDPVPNGQRLTVEYVLDPSITATPGPATTWKGTFKPAPGWGKTKAPKKKAK